MIVKKEVSNHLTNSESAPGLILVMKHLNLQEDFSALARVWIASVSQYLSQYLESKI